MDLTDKQKEMLEKVTEMIEGLEHRRGDWTGELLVHDSEGKMLGIDIAETGKRTCDAIETLLFQLLTTCMKVEDGHVVMGATVLCVGEMLKPFVEGVKKFDERKDAEECKRNADATKEIKKKEEQREILRQLDRAEMPEANDLN